MSEKLRPKSSLGDLSSGLSTPRWMNQNHIDRRMTPLAVAGVRLIGKSLDILDERSLTTLPLLTESGQINPQVGPAVSIVRYRCRDNTQRVGEALLQGGTLLSAAAVGSQLIGDSAARQRLSEHGVTYLREIPGENPHQKLVEELAEVFGITTPIRALSVAFSEDGSTISFGRGEDLPVGVAITFPGSSLSGDYAQDTRHDLSGDPFVWLDKWTTAATRLRQRLVAADAA